MTSHSIPKILLIHVGMPKAASTSLQKSLFFSSKEIEAFKKKKSNALYKLATLTSYNFEKQKEDIKQEILKQFSGKKPAIITEEMFLYGRAEQKEKFIVYSSYQEIAKRLNDLFPNAKILIIIRNQLKWLPSAYSEWCKAGFLNHRQFSSFADNLLEAYQTGCNTTYNSLKYDIIYTNYCDLFGKENVYIELFETFIGDQEASIRKMMDFLGIDSTKVLESFQPIHSNARPTVMELFIRKINREYGQSNIIKRLKKLLGCESTGILKLIQSLPVSNRRVKNTLTEEQNKLFSEHFASSNSRLKKLTGLPLGNYGYPLK
ncbi:sulfotransferase [uncultured Draconibacterium sp.]|uniref:sulfotransferase n=1 Tax=uncultured Draconibacterium sp. TaxID=1573823 RepID=UPI002AA8F483|nr:sulfotransferase [uncultured Draconibacterium sp.]